MRALGLALLTLALVLPVATSHAGPRGTVKNFEFASGSGTIDYDGGYVEATAVGTADVKRMVSSVQAEQVSRRTARHLAYEVLAETVGKIQVDAKSLYQDAILASDALKVETHAVIRGAQIVKDAFEWVPDPMNQGMAPRATTTLRLYLTGDEGLGHLLDKFVPPDGGFVDARPAAPRAPAKAAQVSAAPAPPPTAVPPPPEVKRAPKEKPTAPPAAGVSLSSVASAPATAPPPATAPAAGESPPAAKTPTAPVAKAEPPPAPSAAAEAPAPMVSEAAAPPAPAPAGSDVPRVQEAPQVRNAPVAAPVAAATATAPEPPAGPKFSSLVVDTRGADPRYEPALRVYIRDEAGKVVYGPGVARASIEREGRRFYRYTASLDEARASFDQGTPLVVKAKAIAGPGDVTIASDDARTVMRANEQDPFLREARVVLVLP